MEDQKISLKELVLLFHDWFRYFLSKWVFIVSLGIVGGVIGFVYAYLSKPIFTAELTLALDDKGRGGGAYAGIASQFGIDLGGESGGAFAGDNNIELIKSRRLIEETLLTPVTIDGQRQTLINRYISSNQLSENLGLKGLSFLPDENPDSFPFTKDSVLFVIYKKIKKSDIYVARLDKKLSIITLNITSEDPYFAKCFADKLIENATAFYIGTKTQKSRKNVDILEYRLDSVKRELNKELYGAAVNKDMNTNVVRAIGGIQSKRKEMNIQVLATMYTELVKNMEMAKFILLKEEPMIQIIDRPKFPLESKQPGKLVSMILGGIIAGIIGLLFFTYLRLVKLVKT